MDGGKRALAVKGRLAGGNATCEGEECVQRTCEDMILLTNSEKGKRLHVVDGFY